MAFKSQRRRVSSPFCWRRSRTFSGFFYVRIALEFLVAAFRTAENIARVSGPTREA
jgi:hypothetical protein